MALIALGSLTSCAWLDPTFRLEQIYSDMTAQEVVNLIGRPDYRSFDREGDVWEYRRNDEVRALIFFEKGRVTAMRVFNVNDYRMRPFPERHRAPQGE